MQNMVLMLSDAFEQPVPHLFKRIYNAKLLKQLRIPTVNTQMKLWLSLKTFGLPVLRCSFSRTTSVQTF